MNEAGDRFYAYYHDGIVTSGSSPDNLLDRWDEDKTYQLPGDAQNRRYNIVDIARFRPVAKMLCGTARAKPASVPSLT